MKIVLLGIFKYLKMINNLTLKKMTEVKERFIVIFQINKCKKMIIFENNILKIQKIKSKISKKCFLIIKMNKIIFD